MALVKLKIKNPDPEGVDKTLQLGVESIEGTPTIPSFLMTKTVITNRQWSLGSKREEHWNKYYLENSDDSKAKVYVSLYEVLYWIEQLPSQANGSWSLPTVEQWLLAAGSYKKENLKEEAWVEDYCSILIPRYVQKKKPNHNGLYDMYGLCWEWVYTNHRTVHHPQVVAGGAVTSSIKELPYSKRDPRIPHEDVGFRLVYNFKDTETKNKGCRNI